MEENKDTNVSEMNPSYEQLKATAMQLLQRAMAAENKLSCIDFVNVRLNWLFKVIDNTSHFPVEFVGKCIEEVMELMTVEKEEKEEENTEN